MAQGLLSPVTAKDPLPPPPASPVLSADLPPGAIAGGIPDGMRGTFTGGVLNWLPDYFNQWPRSSVPCTAHNRR